MTVNYRAKDDVYVVVCRKPHCTLSLAVATAGLATDLDEGHLCPRENGTTHFSLEITLTIISECWATMDAQYVLITQATDPQMEREARERLRGMIAIAGKFFPDHLSTLKAIGSELVKRAEMKANGIQYETFSEHTRFFETIPGVAQHHHPGGLSGVEDENKTRERAHQAAVTVKAKSAISAEVRQEFADALAMGLTPKMLEATFSLTGPQVAALIAELSQVGNG